MSNQTTTETLGGISRSGRVRKKSTKLMESLEISKSAVKSEKVLGKSPPGEKKTLACGISSPSEPISIKLEVANFPPEEYDEEHQIEEEMVTETVTTTERLPLSAEGLPLAVPASGYYTYQGQFSHVLPKTDSPAKIVKKKSQKNSKDKSHNQPNNEILKTGMKRYSLVAMTTRRFCRKSPEQCQAPDSCSLTDSPDKMPHEQESLQVPVKKKKTTKFKDIMAGADWDKLKKKKKKKKEKEKLAKAIKIGEMKPLAYPSGMLNADNDDSNSGSVGLVIAEPTISLPPKKRKKSGSETKKSIGEPKKKAEGRKSKKAKASKPVNNEITIGNANVNGTNVGVKLEQLAEGGTIDDSDMVPEPSEGVVSSQYLSEKKARRIKEKFVVGADGVVTAKKRRPRPMTAYMLWCKENRPKIVAEDPSKSKDFAAISRRMGEVWQTLTDKEKMSYRRRAKKIGRRGTMISTGKKGANKQNQQTANRAQQGARRLASSSESSSSKLYSSSSSDLLPVYKVTGSEPIDVAAHMKLLGESLAIIGQRLTENEGQIAVSGSLSVLLDSTLCALGPLLCLTNQISEMNGMDSQTQASCLDSIAYVMPGFMQTMTQKRCEQLSRLVMPRFISAFLNDVIFICDIRFFDLPSDECAPSGFKNILMSAILRL
ncbi:HMG domain-containing protein 4 [Nymphon striatum]|nr:HMG domain-containing protein 4 [Nymphon striatum]